MQRKFPARRPVLLIAPSAVKNILGIEENRDDVMQSFIGPPLLQRFMEVYGGDRDTALRLQTDYRRYYSEKGVYENEVYDGVPEMLGALRERGFILVLTTSKPYQYVDLLMDYFDLGKYFDFISSADIENGRSSKIQVLEHALEALSITDRSEVILIGDRMYDADGACEAGIDCMGVLYGYGSREELETHGVKYIAETVEDITKFFR